MNASTSSSFDPKWRYGVAFATAASATTSSIPTARMPLREKSV
jgi:hypothetical protein